VIDVNAKVWHLAFEVFGQHIWVVHQDLKIILVYFVIEDVFVVVQSLVKNQCTSATFIALMCVSFLHFNFRSIGSFH
jgi:hypothetical protein